jgi:zinc transport system substrate-binding protein
MKQILSMLVLSAALLLAACAPAVAPAAADPAAADLLNVTVSIAPQKYFVERIGAQFVNVRVMVEPGESPATYEPKPEQMTALSNSAAYISIGVPFEKAWLEKFRAANSTMKMVDTTQGIDRIAIANGGFNPHIWLSPALVKIQSETIYAALVELDPAHKEQFKVNLDAFLAEIDQLDSEIRATLAQTASKKFIVFHPAWGYFARDYGLQEISIEVGGQEPSAQELANLITMAKDEDIKVVFVQPEFSQEDAQTIAREIGGEALSVNSLAPDWFVNIKKVAETFAAVLNQ